LTCDNVLSCEVVTAEGELVTANSEINEDLFWGLRGGGGNFGIVTSFLYRAHPVSTVLGGVIAYKRDQAAAMLRYYRDFMLAAPDELTAYAGLISMPDGTPAAGVMACYCGDVTEGERVLEPLRAFGSPVSDAIQPMPFPMMQKLADEMSPDSTHNYWRSTFIRGLSDEVIDLLIEHGSRMESRLSRIVTVLRRRCWPSGPCRYGVCSAASRVQCRDRDSMDRCRREGKAHWLDAHSVGCPEALVKQRLPAEFHRR
jgi:hypothetical protein